MERSHQFWVFAAFSFRVKAHTERCKWSEHAHWSVQFSYITLQMLLEDRQTVWDGWARPVLQSIKQWRYQGLCV